MKKTFIALSLLLAAVFALSGCNQNTPVQVPEGYDADCYLKLRTFLETEDKCGVKNGDKLWTDPERGMKYDADDPKTWNNNFDDISTAVLWYPDKESGLMKIGWLGLCNDDLVGKADLSGMKGFDTSYGFFVDFSAAIRGSGITGLCTDGCEIESLDCSGCSIEKIDWKNQKYDIDIMLRSRGGGFVGVSYLCKGSDYDWYVNAYPKDNTVFVGWFDKDGNCVCEEPEYVFAVIDAVSEVADGPEGAHLNLEARFKKGK